MTQASGHFETRPDESAGRREPPPDLERMLSASDHALHDLVRFLSGPRHRPQLLQLLTGSPAWLIAKQRRLGGDRPFLTDLTIAIDGFQDPLEPDEVLGLVRLHAVRSVVHGRATERGERIVGLVSAGRIQDALDAAVLLADPAARFGALKSLWLALAARPDAVARQHAGVLGMAREAAAAMPGGFPGGQERANALAWVLGELLRLGERDAARETLDEMERIIGDREASVERLLLAYTGSGELDKALALVSDIRNVWTSRDARSELARRLWKRKRRKEAKGLASTADSPFVSAGVLTTLAIEAGGDARTRLFAEALRIAREVPRIPATETERPWDLKCEALRSLARALASVGDLDRAREAMNEIPYRFDYVLTCIDLAAEARKAGRHDLAGSLLAEGAQAAASVRDSDSRAHLENLLAQSSTPSGTDSGARESGARPASDRREAPKARPALPARTVEHRLRILEARAALFFRAAQPERAAALLDDARRLVGDTTPKEKVTLAEIFLRLDLLDDALSLLQGTATDDVLAGLVKGSVEAGRLAQARSLIHQIEDRIKRGAALKTLLNRLIESRRWDEALEMAETFPPLFPFWAAKERIAWSLIRAGHPERGFELASTLGKNDQLTGSVLALYARGRLDLARELIAMAIQRSPSAVGTFASALAGDGLYREAADLLRELAPRQLDDAMRVALAVSAAFMQDFAFAEEAAQEIGHLDDLDRARQAIVAGLRQAGRVREAETLAASIHDPRRQAAGMRGFPMLSSPFVSVETWLEEGQMGFVRLVAYSVEPQARVRILGELWAAHATVGDLEAAVAVAKEIPNGAVQAEALQRLAGRLAAERKLEAALTLARDIPQAMSRAFELQGVEPLLGHLVLARDIRWRENPETIYFPDQVVRALARIATELHLAGSSEEALSTLSEARQIADTHPLEEGALRELSRALAVCNRWRAAFDVRPLTDAHHFALDVHDLYDRLEARQPGLGLTAAEAAAEIAGWYDEDWQEVALT